MKHNYTNTKKDRGENSFVKLPHFAARLYDKLSKTKAIEHQHIEIAQELVSEIESGRLLDIGTGPGRLLLEIHKLNSNIELYALDISESMVELAKNNLASIKANLHCGSIMQTNYENDFFDLITCTGSFYLWNNPKECLTKIYRILKRGCSAFLFETYKDFDKAEFSKALKINLKEENLARKLITPILLRRQLGMTYQISEIEEIIKNTDFAQSFVLGKVTLGGLPVWLQVKLTKKLF